MISKKQLVDFLTKTSVNAGLIDKLKIRYRPWVCPYHELLSLIKPGDKVLDIGFGSGQFALLVSEFSEAKKISGIEIREKLVNQANQLFGKRGADQDWNFSLFDGENFPANLNEYNLIFLIDVLHHISKKQQILFLSRIYDKMSPSASLILKDINASSILVLFNKLHDLVLAGETGHELSVTKARQLSEKIGFSVVKEEKKRQIFYPHYWLVLNKDETNLL